MAHIRRLCLMLVTFLAPLMGQSWDSLRSLPPGAQVWVLDSTGQDHRGKFSSISDTALTIETGHGQDAIDRTRVRRVVTRGPSRRLRNTLVGAGIGLGVGLLADATLGQYLRNEPGESSGTRALTYIAPIGVFGAIGASLPGRRTVYKSK